MAGLFSITGKTNMFLFFTAIDKNQYLYYTISSKSFSPGFFSITESISVTGHIFMLEQ